MRKKDKTLTDCCSLLLFECFFLISEIFLLLQCAAALLHRCFGAAQTMHSHKCDHVKFLLAHSNNGRKCDHFGRSLEPWRASGWALQWAPCGTQDWNPSSTRPQETHKNYNNQNKICFPWKVKDRSYSHLGVWTDSREVEVQRPYKLWSPSPTGSFSHPWCSLLSCTVQQYKIKHLGLFTTIIKLKVHLLHLEPMQTTAILTDIIWHTYTITQHCKN